ncbi:MAG: hypothetical protein QOE69_2323 [Thermoleophilaceae bacterium]|jgi:hypothetical protein|nr:hypothetical protein [Thermoleophilaceae bacterium]
MILLAAMRPDDWNLPLFLHILGAMLLVGALVLVALALANRDLRLGFRALLIGVLPGWVVMRGAAQWIADKEGLNDLDSSEVPSWVNIGYIVSEPGLLLILVATACAGLAASRQRGDRLRVAALVLVGILLVGCVVAIWAMSAKPT